MSSYRIAFIGGGNITRAIAGGLVQGGMPAKRILVAEPLDSARASLAAELPGATITDDNAAAAAAAECVVLSVKPQVLADVCRDLAATVQRTSPLVVSIAAGVRSDDVDRWLGGGMAIVRIMPNQPALLRRGVSGLFANPKASAEQVERAAEIMAAVGTVVSVPGESDIDTVTAVSGSGPAYFFLLIDVLQQTAEALGLDGDTARILAIETASGAAALASSEHRPMHELIARVRSPGGTTVAALDYLEASDVRGIFAAAVTAARDRAVVLADKAHSSQD